MIELEAVWFATARVAACLILRSGTRIAPVWTTAAIAERIQARQEYTPSSPDPMDVVADLLEDVGIRRLVIDSYYRGQFLGTIEAGEKKVDCRVSDLLVLHLATGVKLEIDPDLLAEVGFTVAPGTDVLAILDGEAELPEPDATVGEFIDVSDDDEFLRLMRDLGVEDAG
ncbi:MAG: bifunctional nuclease domain-containing protein [Corynebacterium sp.]|nr:bifunctional nuclease domain-containing protein [Corynebacterium sp.]